MRVLHVLDHSTPLHSGYTFRTLNILREQRERGWETFHLTSPKHSAPSGPFETVDGWQFFRTPAPGGIKLPWLSEWALVRATQQRLLEVARDVRPDILHAHSPVLDAIPALRVGRELGVPVVYEVRAFWEDAAVDHGTTTEGSLRYRLVRQMESRVLRQVDHVFTICEGLRQEIVTRGVPSTKVTVIPNAVDIHTFSMGGVPDQSLKASLGLQGCRIVGFIGSFYAYEGLDLLLSALPRLLEQHADARVLLVGGGPQDAALRAQAAALGLSDKVVFTGRVPHKDVQKYYDFVDVLAYPRHKMRLTDLVTPLKPLEAMAQGRVVVASDVGGHRELIRHGRTGMLFKADDASALAKALAEVLDSPQLVSTLREEGRRYVETERHWRGSIAHYAPAYERLAARRLAA
jgi:PEP-CTERM/exosortase A-associated glycosyltransferase